MSTILAHHSSTVPSTTPVLWLRADKGVTVDGNGKVTDWTDQGSGGYNAYQTTEVNRPLLVQNALNGKPSLFFDGTDDYMDLNSIYSSSNMTLFIIMNNKDSSDGSVPLVYTNDSQTFPIYFGVDRIRWRINPDFFDYNYNTINKTLLITETFDNATLKITVNGDNGSYTSLFNGDGPMLFNNIGDYGQPYKMHGNIFEIIIYNQILSDAERITVENYLKNKYAII